MWKGPREDGITQSMLNKFHQCPYCFYLYAILGLEDAKPLDQNLIWGDSYHVGLEYLIKTRDFPLAVKMCLHHLTKEYPQAPPSFKYSIPKMLRLYSTKHHEGDWDTEILIDKVVDGIRWRGKMDAITRNHPDYGSCLGEHKCKGYVDAPKTWGELKDNLQLNIYMYLNDIEDVVYDLIKIPDVQKYAPAQSKGDTVEEHTEKLYSGPISSYGGRYPIRSHQNQWIYQKHSYIPREHQEKYWAQTVRPWAARIEQWYDHVTRIGFDPDSPKWFNEVFYRNPVRHFDGRKTVSFECDYYQYLIGEQDLHELRPIKGYFNELQEEEKEAQ